jgi:hypothetical protein
MIRPTSQNSLPSKGKSLINRIQKTETIVENVPEGYVTGEVFRNNVKSKIFKHYKDNGLL